MVDLRKRRVGKSIYYYLEQSVRLGKTVKKIRKYLGKSIPKDINEIKEQFIEQMHAEEWYPLFNQIKKKYTSEWKRTPPEVKDKELEAFMVEFTYDTQKIEGSRLSYKDTSQILLEQTTPKGARLVDVKEAEAHRTVFYEMLDYKDDISLEIVLKWHRELFEETKKSIAGRIRDYDVRITNTRFRPPHHIYMESMLNNFFAWYNGNKKTMQPVELAALTHLKFVTIHPFGDGNGRISRLIMNFVLNRNGYPLLNIRYVNRRGYYTSLERSQIKNDQNIFLRWFFRKYITENKKYAAT